VAQIGGVEQADVAEVVLDVELPAIGGGVFDERPDGEFSRDAALPSRWQEVEEWSEQVRLDGEAAVGGLDPVGLADAGDLRGELALAFRIAYMLDYRVAEDDIEGAVGEGKGAAVGEDAAEVDIERFAGAGHIDDGHARVHVEQRPVEGRTAYIEDAGFSGDGEGAGETAHTARAEVADGGIEQGRSSLACKMQDHAAAVRVHAVLKEIDALPGAERQGAVYQRDA
jgi:hypothetical protein